MRTLRRLRDEHLAGYAAGRWLIARYYDWSPPLAAKIADRPRVAALVRGALAPVVLVAGHWLDRPWVFALAVCAAAAMLARARSRPVAARLAGGHGGLTPAP